MIRSEEFGCSRIWLTGDEGSFMARLDEYEKIRDAFLAGNKFVATTDLYGEEMIIRFLNVNVVSRSTPESTIMYNKDRAEEKAKEITE